MHYVGPPDDFSLLFPPSRLSYNINIKYTLVSHRVSKSGFRVRKVSWRLEKLGEMGLRQIEQDFSSFFGQIFDI